MEYLRDSINDLLEKRTKLQKHKLTSKFAYSQLSKNVKKLGNRLDSNPTSPCNNELTDKVSEVIFDGIILLKLLKPDANLEGELVKQMDKHYNKLNEYYKRYINKILR